MGTVGKCTVGPVLDAVSSGVSLIDTRACLVVAKVVASLSITGCPMEVGTSVVCMECECVFVCVYMCVRCVCMYTYVFTVYTSTHQYVHTMYVCI